jgi:REP element-mobilizing transposase RayT
MKIKINIYLHTIFCTSEHQNLIGNPKRIKELISESFQFYNCELFEVSATTNHVHILHSANPEISTDELLKKVKLAVQTKYQREINSDFFWDPGYYVFTIGADELESEKFNLLKQSSLHSKQSLDTELKQYLEDIELDETDDLTDIDEHRFN